MFFFLRVGVQLACFLWSDMRGSVHAGVSPCCILPATKGNERGAFSQPLDLQSCNHMAITPSWRAPFILPSHLWLPAPGFISPATDWWNSAYVQCNPAYAYISALQLWIFARLSASGCILDFLTYLTWADKIGSCKEKYQVCFFFYFQNCENKSQNWEIWSHYYKNKCSAVVLVSCLYLRAAVLYFSQMH